MPSDLTCCHGILALHKDPRSQAVTLVEGQDPPRERGWWLGCGSDGQGLQPGPGGDVDPLAVARVAVELALSSQLLHDGLNPQPWQPGLLRHLAGRERAVGARGEDALDSY